MEAHEKNTEEGFLSTCTCEGGSGVFTFIYALLAIGFLLSIVVFG